MFCQSRGKEVGLPEIIVDQATAASLSAFTNFCQFRLKIPHCTGRKFPTPNLRLAGTEVNLADAKAQMTAARVREAERMATEWKNSPPER